MIQLVEIEKKFGEQVIVYPLSLDIKEGEFLTMLGPSGCGKTTLLRMIAGFEQPSKGEILFDAVRVTHLPPNQRDVNLVFQHYALFPHLNVEQNIAFGLKMKKMPILEQKNRVQDAVRLTQLKPYLNKYPHQLSGGQQQRVAIARAIVNKPQVLLLDEPLGALDLQLRRNLQTELKQLQRELGITFVYVTHDQEEAMMLSDRVVIMNHGRVEQIGTPQEIYNLPRTLFTAMFVGENNIFYDNGRTYAVRPEKLRVLETLQGNIRRQGVIQDIVYLGNVHKLLVRLSGDEMTDEMTVSICLDFKDQRVFNIGQEVGVDWHAGDEVKITS